MIFYCDLQGNLKAFQNETVYQGSNNVTTIYVVAPFNRPVGLNISFTKPNKLVTSPAVMKWVGTLGNVKIPVSFVNIPEQFTDTYNVWAYALPYSITEQNGVVGVSVNAVIADSVDASGNQAYKGNLTTFTGQFTVAYSALPSPPTDIPTEWTQDKVLDLLNNYYNDAIQKIGEMNTLKTNAKDTLVKAINEVFDEIASTNATIGDLSTLTTDEKTTIVGAINEVDQHADTAQQTADTATELANTGISKAEQAQATANGAVATANEAKGIAQTAENNANSAVDKANDAVGKANEAIMKADAKATSIGFMTAKDAVTALNGYPRTQLKGGDTIWIVEDGTPDLWVTDVAQESVPYNYTTKDKFNQDLVDNKVLQIGYFKTAYQESDGKPVTIAWQNVLVKSTDWVASTEFADFPYEAKIELTDFVDYTTVPQVVFDIADTMSGNYAPICKSGDKCVYIYGKVQDEITLKTVITFAPNVNGASVTGGGYNNRGKWVASTTYEIDDLVYTDNGQFVCIEGITSTTSPEQDTTHWQATFVATGKTKNGLKFSGQNTDGSAVQKTFDGSTAVEIAFDETTMTAKEVNGVLKVGAKGTVPEALPQEASALKSGNLPISGWVAGGPFWTGMQNIKSSQTVSLGTFTGAFDRFTSSTVVTLKSLEGEVYELNRYDSAPNTKYYKYGNSSLRLQVHNTDEIKLYNGRTLPITVTELTASTFATHSFYTISDTSITANSDILMELTDDGGVKSYSMEAGKITVIRDTVPTQPIPYTYKVKQTNASGQFTVINHFVPSIPESPTSLPVTYKKVSGELPTSGWNTIGQTLWTGNYQAFWHASSTGATVNVNINDFTQPVTFGIQFNTSGTKTATIASIESDHSVQTFIHDGYTFSTLVYADKVVGNGIPGITVGAGSLTSISIGRQGYTISDTDITANTAVKMYLTDAGGVKAQSKASGSITVIRDTVPTTAIPYEYEVEQTSAEGLFEVINAYVPAKTSELTNDSGFITAADIGNALYPVGSIYMSVNNTNPSTFFGGTWEAWGAGKVPVGVDANDTDFATVEQTGGEKTHTLTVSEMPSHKHTVEAIGSGTTQQELTAFNVGTTSGIDSYAGTDFTGGGQAHNNLQPYITCYMWKRTE